MSNYTKKCKKCKGTGRFPIKMDSHTACPICEGSGIQLFSAKEEEYNDAVELTGDKVFKDQEKFIDLEEEDYEI